MDFYLFHHEQQTGPYTEADARALVATGQIERTCLTWREGMAEWLPLDQVVAFPVAEDRIASAPTTGPSDRSHRQHSLKTPKVVVSLLLILTVVFALAYFIKHPKTALPNREDFTRALATVHFVAAPPGKIIVADKWDQQLVLELTPEQFENPPSYKIVVPADPLPIDYEHFTNVPSDNSSETNFPSVLDRHKAITLDSPGLPDLIAAVDTLVEWSITASETKTNDIQRRISGDEYNKYVFQGIRRENRYILLYAWFQQLSMADFNSSGGTPRSNIYPVTSFARAHLWKYLFDHYDEVKLRADAYRAMMRDEAEKTNALSEDKAREAQALEKARINREGAARSAEQSRLDQLFPVPSQSPAADRK